MSGHFGPHVSNAVAELISHRGAHHARELNKVFALAEVHSISRAVFTYGAATVAEVARRYPAAFADHHHSQRISG